MTTVTGTTAASTLAFTPIHVDGLFIDVVHANIDQVAP